MKLPNFLIAGVSASGTSFLAESIRQHPDIYLPFPMEPECHFFLSHGNIKRGQSITAKKVFKNLTMNTRLEKGLRHIYLEVIRLQKKIFSNFPNIKLIFCIRN